jgi:hypothetical protein
MKCTFCKVEIVGKPFAEMSLKCGNLDRADVFYCSPPCFYLALEGLQGTIRAWVEEKALATAGLN